MKPFIALIGTLLLAVPIAFAQTYPSKPIRFVVPSSAGGGNDYLARLFGARITENWGQQVLVDLRPGAAGIVGSEIVAKSPPDGHTLLIVATGYGLNPSLYSNLPYDTINDFARINLLAFSPNVLVVHPSLPVKSAKQLIALAKSRPGDLNYASSGAGTGGHLSIELLKHMAGINMVHVPYKGAGDATMAVVSGQVHMLMTAPGAAIPFVKAGRLRALAVGSATRVKAMPDVPTVAEAALPGYEVDGFYGILAPGKTPRPIVDKLYAEFDRILKLPDVSQQMEARGFDPVSYPPDKFTEHVKKEMQKWPPVFKAAGIKVN
jgi:tripartite-type tricarboxylate transporter receptor subunit TctC